MLTPYNNSNGAILAKKSIGVILAKKKSNGAKYQ